jgi:hypothetical protein
VNVVDDNGDTPLHYAVTCVSASADLVRVLIAAGADPSKRNRTGWLRGATPLDALQAWVKAARARGTGGWDYAESTLAPLLATSREECARVLQLQEEGAAARAAASAAAHAAAMAEAAASEVAAAEWSELEGEGEGEGSGVAGEEDDPWG